jgi:STE24 endopeptidase
VHLVVLLLVAVVALEARSGDATPSFEGASALVAPIVLVVPAILVLAAQSLAIRRALRLLDRGDQRGAKAIDRAERWALLLPWATLLGLAAAVLGAGWLSLLRSAVGDPPLVDELLALAPSIALLALGWWVHEPIERRLREAGLIRRLDEGTPVSTWPSRTAFVASRLRTNVLIVLVPVLAVVATAETVAFLVAPAAPAWWNSGGRELATLGSAAFVYLFSPWILRGVLDCSPMPAGSLRADLEAVCTASGVRIADLLVWRTADRMLNGAVVGLLPRIRYVLLTDGLLELLPRGELRAVMAHEVGHVRRRHLPWLLGSMIVLLVGAALAIEPLVQLVFESLATSGLDDAEFRDAVVWVDRGATLVAAAAALVGFGWVSRRFERQADVFAVQHLTRAAGSDDIVPDAVASMSGALERVAAHAGVSPTGFSWRHGSIRWRQRYLAGLIGQRVDRLAIDRLVGRLKLCVALGVVGIAAILYAEQDGGSGGEPDGDADASIVQAAGTMDPCAS